ncbi:MAG: hypothetical protein FWF53_11355 [Candidatus Azobacteroides sp.]|nr:hypothetical protein [Candidatus Azobacteroides sp.]
MKDVKTIFEQKRGLSLRKFTLYRDKIIIEIKTIRKNQKYELKLDKIGHNIHYQSDSTIVGKIFFYICLAIPIILWIIHFIAPNQMDKGAAIVNTALWWLLALINILKKSEDDIYLLGGQNNLVFFRTIPNEETVLNFINQIIETSKTYLKNKYGIVDAGIPEDIFFNRLNWLKDEEIISEKEFYELKNEYSIKKLLS